MSRLHRAHDHLLSNHAFRILVVCAKKWRTDSEFVHLIEGTNRGVIRTIVKGLYNRDAVEKRPSPPAIVRHHGADGWQYRATDVGIADLRRAYKEAEFRIRTLKETGLYDDTPTGQTAA